MPLRGQTEAPQRAVFTTTDPDAARAWMIDAYAGRELTVSGDFAGFRFIAVGTGFAGIRLGWVRHSMAAHGTMEPADHLLVVQAFGDGGSIGT